MSRLARIAVFWLLGAALALPALANERTSRLQGRTYLDRNDQVIGATVVVRPADDGSKLFLTSADGSGHFRVDALPDGDYDVLVRRNGYSPVTKRAVGLKFPFRAVVEIQMESGEDVAAPLAVPTDASGAFSVQGSIATREGDPIDEARIRLVRDDASRDPFDAQTRADGAFALDEVDAGIWRLEVVAVGYVPLRQPVTIGESTEIRITLVQQPADYQMSPLELMPREDVRAPAGLR